ncbi:hypothetical protein GCM10027277_22990 [Pseudoduganella ginsengisoli]|uniref:Transmembrane protein n=1 Tax=Pseudoduganella ginsengisoli TaxID=1462440 RepID=A0A6L6Q835_9BURK|nr:hypothetical protein [Pseudoduganella ginsengisoli]MTW05441.1 hypothetical protein [Pseudoduganella ginsengisoli]
MKRLYTLRRRLLAPLVYTAALILLLEEWLWDLGERIMAAITRLIPMPRVRSWICSLGPIPALCLFLLPGLALFPVKILALFAIAKGHAFAGISTIVIAKVAGAALVARIYALTQPALMRMAWFAWGHGRFLELRDRWIGRLRATRAWQNVQAIRSRVQQWRHDMRRRLSPARHARNGVRLLRVLRRYIAQWRARRKQP